MAEATGIQLDGAQVKNKIKSLIVVLPHFLLLNSSTCIFERVNFYHRKCTVHTVAKPSLLGKFV